MKILLFDNYDSFTYNLVHSLRKLQPDAEVEVHRNDAISLEEVQRFDRIVLSPGPGIPSEAGNLLPLIEEYASKKPILGVCLGHQALAEAHGGTLKNLSTPFHGLSIDCELTGETSPLFQNLPQTFPVGRYHSWVVEEATLPTDWTVTARDAEGYIMAMQHKSLPLHGVQFHPESILTPDGDAILRNWLNT